MKWKLLDYDRVYVGIIWRLCKDNGKEHGNYYIKRVRASGLGFQAGV